ncbi:MAG TPA: c-type cytochrome biogenesis protein CcmI [Xanthobacteraceae bacterium]|nr:c-type cytochrome biogenesis protein CcmI [Xanthobacteraceae bacterium]
MLFWSLLALMTAAAVLAVLWPLSRTPRLAEETAGVAVYRDQLAEIEQDRARGVLNASEADAAKIEVSRRLLGAAAQDTPKADASVSRRRIAAIVALAGVPLLSLSLYLALGAPEFPDAPLAERLAKPIEQQDIGILIGRIEERLAAFPEQGQGWELIAPIYLRVGRTGDAIAAQEKAIQLLGSTVARQITLGEYIRNANGRITPESKAAFERALALNEKSSPALFYLGLEAEQSGNLADARKYWSRIVENATDNDQWRIPAQRRLRLIEQKQ